MSINRWIILGLSVFLFIEVLGFSLPSSGGHLFSVQYVAAVVSLTSLLCFLGLFFASYVICAFQAGLNPYVNDVKDMEWNWIFNPMYFAWLFANHRRRWCLYSIIIMAPLGLIFGWLISFAAAQNNAASSDLASGSFAGMGFMAIATLCWYKGVCKPLTLAEDDEEEATEQSDDEQYSARAPND
jgi:hypothetical protein